MSNASDSAPVVQGALRYPKGIVICREGGIADHMYYLTEGTITAYKNEVPVASYAPGSLIGEISFFLGQPNEAKLVAASDITVIAINRSNIYAIYASQPEVTYRVMEQMSHKVDGLQKALQAAQAAAKAPRPAPKESAPVTKKESTPAVKADVRKAAVPKAEAKPAPKAAKPAGAASVNKASRKINWQSPLFPKNHGSYTIPLQNDSDILYEDKMTCPVCKEEFTTMRVIVTKLRQEGTDADLRPRYKDVDPMHYDIITCPHCLYSMAADEFEGISKRLAVRVQEELAPYQSDILIQEGKKRDSFTVIAGYYLALRCTTFCADNHEIAEARHWQKLSRIYQDCEDEAMYLYASEQSLERFRFAYEHFDYSPRQMQQMCFIIGDLYQKLGDLEAARNYFYQAKSNRGGTAVMKRNADMKLEEIKELLKDTQA